MTRWKKILVTYKGYPELKKEFRTKKAMILYTEDIRTWFGDFMLCNENVQYIW